MAVMYLREIVETVPTRELSAHPYTRCPLEPESKPRSHELEPALRDTGGGHLVACHLVGPGGEAPQLIGDTAVELGAGG